MASGFPSIARWTYRVNCSSHALHPFSCQVASLKIERLRGLNLRHLHDITTFTCALLRLSPTYMYIGYSHRQVQSTSELGKLSKSHEILKIGFSTSDTMYHFQAGLDLSKWVLHYFTGWCIKSDIVNWYLSSISGFNHSIILQHTGQEVALYLFTSSLFYKVKLKWLWYIWYCSNTFNS